MRLTTLPMAAVLAALSALSSAAKASAEDVALVVDDAKVLHTLPEAFNGNNFVPLWNSTGESPGTKKAFSQLGAKLLRFPGGCPCEWYDWKDPLFTGWTTITPDHAWDLARASGAQMIFQTNVAGNGYDAKAHPGEKFHFDSSGAHMAEWVKAAQAANVKVALWEIGNEPELDAPGHVKSNQDTIFAWYNGVFAEHAKAIKEADPKARVMGPASCNTWFWWHEKNIERFLAAHGDKKGDGLADAVSIHWYPGGGDGPWEKTRGTAQGWKACADYLFKQIGELDSRALPLYVTEWNWGGGDKNTSAYTLATGLGNADCIGMFQRTGVSGHTHFCLQHLDHGWGSLAMKGERKPENAASPTFFALSIASRLGNQPLALTNPADEANVLSAYASKDASGGMQVLLINKCERALSANVSFTGFACDGKEAQVYTLAGANGKPDDFDVVYNEVPAPKPSEEDLPAPKTVKVAKTIAREVAPYSLTLIAFAGQATSKAAPAPAKPGLSAADRKALDAAADAAVARTIHRTIKAASAGAEPTTVIDFRRKPVMGAVQGATEEEVTVKLDAGSIQLPWTTLQPASFQMLARGFARPGASTQTYVDYAALCASMGLAEPGRQALASARVAARKDPVDGIELLQRAFDAIPDPVAEPPKADPAKKPAADPKAKDKAGATPKATTTRTTR